MVTAAGTNIIWHDFVEVTDSTNPAIYLKKAYQLSTSGGGYKWCGWRFNTSPDNGKFIRISAWVKFLSYVPPASNGYGFSI